MYKFRKNQGFETSDDPIHIDGFLQVELPKFHGA
jgi:hypothetical protein